MYISSFRTNSSSFQLERPGNIKQDKFIKLINNDNEIRIFLSYISIRVIQQLINDNTKDITTAFTNQNKKFPTKEQ